MQAFGLKLFPSTILTSPQSSDLATTSRALVAIVTICKDAGDWSLLNDQVLLLSKKHGQLKQAITKMVQVVMSFLDDTPDMETKLSVIEALRTVTEGKVSTATDAGELPADITARSLSKLSEHESRESSPISRGNRAISMQQQIFYASCRWKLSAPWDEEKRPSLFSSKWHSA